MVPADGRFAPSPTGKPARRQPADRAAGLAVRPRAGRALPHARRGPRRGARAPRLRGRAARRPRARSGLDWDGPVVRQSERRRAYDAAIERLRGDGLLYECWCTRAEIRDAASAPHGALPEGAYPGTCLRPDGRRARRAARLGAARRRCGCAPAARGWRSSDRLCGRRRGRRRRLRRAPQRRRVRLQPRRGRRRRRAGYRRGRARRRPPRLDPAPALARRAAGRARAAARARPADARRRRRPPGQAPRRRDAGRPRGARPDAGRRARRAGRLGRARGARRAPVRGGARRAFDPERLALGAVAP